MIRAFPNQLNQKEVIKLANGVVPDSSITFESGQHGGQFGGRENPAPFGQGQFQHHQNKGNIQQSHWGGNQPGKTMYPLYFYPCSYCQGIYRWY